MIGTVRRMWAGVVVGAAVVCTMGSASADDIAAKPGEGTISAALGAAKAGDTVVLEAGEYRTT